MRTGKLPENTWKRAVLTELSAPEIHRSSDIEKRRQYSVTDREGTRKTKTVVSSAETLEGVFPGFEKYAVQTAYNDIVTSGAEASGVFLSFILPEETSEQEFRKIAAGAFGKCCELGLCVYDVSAETLQSAEKPMITVRAFGEFGESEEPCTLTPGMDIIMTKWAGLEAGAIIASVCGTILTTRFSDSFLRRLLDFRRDLSIAGEGNAVRHAAGSSSGTVMYALSEGGIFRALWEIGEGFEAGFDVDVRKIPVRQEIIEVCEFMGLNPYEIRSGGSMLIVTDSPDAVLKGMEAAGIPAASIGRTTDKKAKRLFNGDDVRYLDRPAEDALFRLRETV